LCWLEAGVVFDSGWSDVDRQAGVCLPAQFNSVAVDGCQHWLWYQQVRYFLPAAVCVKHGFQ